MGKENVFKNLHIDKTVQRTRCEVADTRRELTSGQQQQKQQQQQLMRTVMEIKMYAAALLVVFCATKGALGDASNDCHDVDEAYCLRNEWLCHNPVFKQRMMRFCRLTCGFCDLPTLKPITLHPPPCEDKDEEYCWKNSFLCQKKGFVAWMKKNCQRTCGYCDKPTPTTPTSPTTPHKPTRPKPSTKPIPPTIPPTKTPERTNPPYKGECGKRKVEGLGVVGGTTAERGAWPWQILLSYGPFPLCGGALIHPRWVVTAAHCVYKNKASPGYHKVTLGEHDRRHREGSEKDIRGSSIYVHPNWNPVTRDSDIALVRLQKPALLGKYVQPACLPSGDVPVGTKCYITGWGKTKADGKMANVLQQGVLPVVENKVCDKKNRKITQVPILDNMICGGSGGTDLVSGCHGDSGGPFVCEINGKWELHGSVSHGSPRCSSTETYTVFSRTNHFTEWIKHKIATAD